MKKSVWFGLVIVLFLALCFSANSAVCPPTVSDADSKIGRGGVKICDIDYMCGVADGVCPELFKDSTGSVANCSRCPDPDCTGFVNGTVYDNSTGIPRPLSGANVSLFFSFVSPSALSDYFGRYALGVPSGYQTIVASKKGYDTVVKEVFVPNNITSGNATVDFYLPLGVCHADCTNEFGRCSPDCENFVFANSSDNCTYASEEIKNACAHKLKGSEVFLEEYNETHSYYADCCEGVKVLRFRPTTKADCKDGSGFLKQKKVVLLNGKLVNLVVAVCEPKR